MDAETAVVAAYGIEGLRGVAHVEGYCGRVEGDGVEGGDGDPERHAFVWVGCGGCEDDDRVGDIAHEFAY